MTTITEVRFAHEDGALAETLASLPALDARVLPETSTDPQQDVYVFKFDNVPVETVEQALEDDHTIAAVHPMPEFTDRNLLGVEFAAEATLMAPRVTREGGFVIDARSERPGREPRGWHERWLLPDREAVHNVWQYAREEGFEFDLLDMHRQGSIDTEYPVRDVLTDEQRVALLTAYEAGYFAEPREASLQDIADTLDHSPSAIGGRIKRGMKSLIKSTLVVERPRE